MIGNGRFDSVGVLKLIGLKKLEKVMIGENCFMWWRSSDPNRQFCLKECDSLKELKIGNGSFHECTVCEIDSLNSLEVIEMGNRCFNSVGVLKLIGLKKLEKVMIGEKCFTQKNGSFTLKECDALRELKIGNGSFCGYSVCEIDSLNSLEVIEMGNGCFKKVSELKLIGLKKLEKAMIGENCFTKEQDDRDYGYSSHDIKSDPNRQFCLKECDALRELKIGNGSFHECTVCEIDSLNSLEVIEMGNRCFNSVGVLKLIGLKKLEKVMIGEKCFTQKNGSFTLKECDALRELKIGNDSFSDYSVCEIDSLNSLEVIAIGGFRGASLELKSDSQRMK